MPGHARDRHRIRGLGVANHGPHPRRCIIFQQRRRLEVVPAEQGLGISGARPANRGRPASRLGTGPSAASGSSDEQKAHHRSLVIHTSRTVGKKQWFISSGHWNFSVCLSLGRGSCMRSGRGWKSLASASTTAWKRLSMPFASRQRALERRPASNAWVAFPFASTKRQAIRSGTVI